MAMYWTGMTRNGTGMSSIKQIQCIAVALENYFPIPCKVSCPCIQSMRMGTRHCKEWENNFPTQLQCTVSAGIGTGVQYWTCTTKYETSRSSIRQV